MTPETSKRLVLVSATLLGGLSVYRDRQGQGSLYKRLWGIGVIFTLLSVVADFAPQLAGPFAGLVLLGSLTKGGDRAIQNLLASVSSKVPTVPQVSNPRSTVNQNITSQRTPGGSPLGPGAQNPA